VLDVEDGREDKDCYHDNNDRGQGTHLAPPADEYARTLLPRPASSNRADARGPLWI